MLNYSIYRLGLRQKIILRAGFEPATYGFLMIIQLQSTALPTELSKGQYSSDRLPPIQFISRL